MIAAILLFSTGTMGTATIALSRAMARTPDPTAPFPKPLNMLLTGAMGWSTIILTALTSIVRFGVVKPALAALALLALHRLIATIDLVPFYRFALAIGLTTLISTILVTSQNLLVRSSL